MGWLEPKPLPAWADAEQIKVQLERALSAELVVMSSTDEELTKWRNDPLRRLVRAWFAEGYDEGEVLRIFEQFRVQLEHEGRDAEDDRILELMDCLIGWCGPDARLTRESPW
jgi:hypothetical protein